MTGQKNGDKSLSLSLPLRYWLILGALVLGGGGLSANSGRLITAVTGPPQVEVEQDSTERRRLRLLEEYIAVQKMRNELADRRDAKVDEFIRRTSSYMAVQNEINKNLKDKAHEHQ